VSNFQTSLDLQNDGLDSRKIVDDYYPEIRELVVDKLGGPSVVKQAIIFDHTIRSRERKGKGEKESNGENIGGYANGAHNDYSALSAKNRVRLLAATKENCGSVTLAEPPLRAKETENIANGHFGIFNVWRHFRADYPVLDYPLAVVDAQSIKPEDFLVAQYIYPNRVDEVIRVLGDDAHKCYYYSEMRHDEALIFKVFDSSSELGLCTADDCPPHTAHTSFKLEQADERTASRESIECHVLVEFTASA
jgi:hypothetical protein